MKWRVTTLLSLILLLSLSACGGAIAEEPAHPTATLHPLFVPQTLPTPTPRPTLPLPSPQPTHEAAPILDEIEFVLAPIFVGELAPEWSLTHSSRLDYEVVTDSELLGAEPALRLQPTDREAVAYFSLNESAAGQYPRNAVFGLTFAIHSGGAWVRGRDVGVTVVGSDANDYWVPGDTSVASPFNLDPVFSETGLHFLGVEGSIPPGNWLTIEFFLDDLIFDPFYNSVVALYFKLAPDLTTPIYLKDIQLLLLPEDLREELP